MMAGWMDMELGLDWCSRKFSAQNFHSLVAFVHFSIRIQLVLGMATVPRACTDCEDT